MPAAVVVAPAVAVAAAVAVTATVAVTAPVVITPAIAVAAPVVITPAIAVAAPVVITPAIAVAAPVVITPAIAVAAPVVITPAIAVAAPVVITPAIAVAAPVVITPAIAVAAPVVIAPAAAVVEVVLGLVGDRGACGVGMGGVRRGRRGREAQGRAGDQAHTDKRHSPAGIAVHSVRVLSMCVADSKNLTQQIGHRGRFRSSIRPVYMRSNSRSKVIPVYPHRVAVQISNAFSGHPQNDHDSPAAGIDQRCVRNAQFAASGTMPSFHISAPDPVNNTNAP
ncbi:hypothetical protein ACQP00_09835 [Dactylosporangium sp. CS-047395]|uniref:hypothetical protein n=1 Tax=Dactylosporangium sp. CS-047395 TaxID=3239936 RepID=UPI003D8CC3EE